MPNLKREWSNLFYGVSPIATTNDQSSTECFFKWATTEILQIINQTKKLKMDLSLNYPRKF